MDKFLGKYNLPKWNKEELENLNRQITADKIKAIIKKLLANKSPTLDGFFREFYKIFKEELTPYHLQTMPKNPRREKTPKLFL